MLTRTPWNVLRKPLCSFLAALHLLGGCSVKHEIETADIDRLSREDRVVIRLIDGTVIEGVPVSIEGVRMTIATDDGPQTIRAGDIDEIYRPGTAMQRVGKTVIVTLFTLLGVIMLFGIAFSTSDHRGWGPS